MDLPHVDSCLFGLLSLEVGSIIIGIICLLISPGLAYFSFKLGDVWRNIQVVFTIACLIGAILLLFGILLNIGHVSTDLARHFKVPVLVKIFVIIWLLSLIYVIVVVIVTILTNSPDTVNAIISGILYILIVGYFVIVVNSYHASVAK